MVEKLFFGAVEMSIGVEINDKNKVLKKWLSDFLSKDKDEPFYAFYKDDTNYQRTT